MAIIRNAMFVAAMGCFLAAFSSPAMAVTVSRVPELNPGSVASALTLLGSGMALLMARRRR